MLEHLEAGVALGFRQCVTLTFQPQALLAL